MRANLSFILTLIVALAGAWLLSGQRFLDWIYLMPDLGMMDDYMISLAGLAEDWKLGAAIPDVFGETRTWLHQLMGLRG